LATDASVTLCAPQAPINDKRVYRLYKLADQRKQRLKLERVPLHECQTSMKSGVWPAVGASSA
jgi:hypothetical protein